MNLSAAILVTAFLVGLVLMVIGVVLDSDWIVVPGALLSIGSLVVVLCMGFILMWGEALTGASP